MFLLGLWFKIYGLTPLEEPSRTILVHLEGEVAVPGLYEVDETTRLGQLIEEAGGLTELAQGVNLAQKLLDGEKIIIPKVQIEEDEYEEGELPDIQPPIQSGIHSMSSMDWQEISGIGQVTAELIMDYLQSNPSAGVDDLINVSGIGEKKLGIIKEYLGNSN